MAGRYHNYRVHVSWSGDTGAAYSRAHVIDAPGKPAIAGSSDPSFRGDAARWNPEELLLAALSACHKLWYLDLCARAGIRVLAYQDKAEGVMVEEPGGAGAFASATLRPVITLAPGSDKAAAAALHEKAHKMCFIARSVNFPVFIAPFMN